MDNTIEKIQEIIAWFDVVDIAPRVVVDWVTWESMQHRLEEIEKDLIWEQHAARRRK